MEWILRDRATGRTLSIGDRVETFRGEVVTLSATYPHDGMTGKVMCRDEQGRENYWYPSVIGAEFVPIED